MTSMEWLLIVAAALAGFLLWRGLARAADGLKAGDPAPGFSLPDQNDTTRTLSDFRDKWLVLYFYPRDGTPGCTRQACTFRDDWQRLVTMGAEVVGISVNDTTSHLAFAKKFSLPFSLLADTKGEVAARYGSIRDLWLTRFARRNTFLIDPEGRVARVYLSANASKNSQEVIEDLQKLRSKN